MKIAIASDHAGYPLKQHLASYLQNQGHAVHDLGVDTADVPADYPDAAEAVANAVLDGRAERGIVVCGSGIGASIAASKITGIYAAVCHDVYSAHQGVEHDRMNVLCLGSRIIGAKVAEEIANAFVRAQISEAERHTRRFEKMRMIEKRYCKDR